MYKCPNCGGDFQKRECACDGALARWNGYPARRKRKEGKYTWAQLLAVNSQLPAALTEAMDKIGWNAFGIYELCQDTIKRVQDNKDLKGLTR